jgi:hypothetical protein
MSSSKEQLPDIISSGRETTAHTLFETRRIPPFARRIGEVLVASSVIISAVLLTPAGHAEAVGLLRYYSEHERTIPHDRVRCDTWPSAEQTVSDLGESVPLAYIEARHGCVSLPNINAVPNRPAAQYSADASYKISGGA